MDNLDIYRAANLLVKQHGLDAEHHAAQKADEFLAKGDYEGAVVWKLITAAVKELLLTPDGHTNH